MTNKDTGWPDNLYKHSWYDDIRITWMYVCMPDQWIWSIPKCESNCMKLSQILEISQCDGVYAESMVDIKKRYLNKQWLNYKQALVLVRQAVAESDSWHYEAKYGQGLNKW